MLAWLMKSPFMIELIEKWSYDYIKMDCEEGKCYGVLAVSALPTLSSKTASPQIGPSCLLCLGIVSYHSQFFSLWRSRYS
jgi:hypothetical protein